MFFLVYLIFVVFSKKRIDLCWVRLNLWLENKAQVGIGSRPVLHRLGFGLIYFSIYRFDAPF